MSDRVKGQYEAYPSRAPGVDGERDIFSPLEDLEVFNYFAYQGARDWSRPFRVLVAGGGTGDASTGLGKQMQDRGIEGEVVYLDLSAASRAVAEERAHHQGLNNVSFHTGSLLDVASMGLGTFDYINCSGVLHHLACPEDGVRALASVLAPGGAVGIMVYGELGRIGVYHAQDMLRMLCGTEELATQVDLAKRVLPALPHSNWLKKNAEQTFTAELDDVEIVDRFLHSCDQAYRVPGCVDLMAAGELRMTAFVPSLFYQPETFVVDPVVLARVKAMDQLEQYAFAELVSGIISTHSFFAVRQEDPPRPPLTLDDPSAVPELLPISGDNLADVVKRNGALALVLGAVTFNKPFTLSLVAERFLRGIDGVTSLADLCTQATGLELSPGTYTFFKAEISPLFKLLNGTASLVLHKGE
jgi:SAM-dependent methyltransferase